jgi:hypothetical protein
MKPGIMVSKSNSSVRKKERFTKGTLEGTPIVETITHNLGYVPLIRIYMNQKQDGSWQSQFTEMSWVVWDDENIYIASSYYDSCSLIYVFAVDIEKDYKNNSPQTLKPFSKKDTKYGIKSMSDNKELFSTENKKISVDTVASHIPPSSIGRFSYEHGYNSPVMFSAFGKHSYSPFGIWGIENEKYIMGKWAVADLGIGAQPSSTYTHVNVDDLSEYYSEVSFVIYGAIK